jgi:hypothetical protein
LLAAFAFAADVRAGPELDVAAVECDQLRYAQTGLDREGQQRDFQDSFQRLPFDCGALDGALTYRPAQRVRRLTR